MKKLWKLFGGCSFLGAVMIRCAAFGKIPLGFNQDGAMAAVDALALANYGTDRFGTWLPAHFKAWGYGQMSVLLSYLMVPFVKLFGLTEITARLPVLLVSILGMAAVYSMVKEAFSEKAAVVTLLFLAINPWHFMQSRWALDCNLFPHMFLFGFCFLYKGTRRCRYLYSSMIFFALCMYSYGVAFYMVPFFLLISCVILLKDKKIQLQQAFICVLIYFLIAFPIYGTMLINFMEWDTVKLPFVTMPYFAENVRSNDILFFAKEPIRQLYVNFKALVNTIFLQKPDFIWNAIDDFGTMYQCSMPLILTGIMIVFWQAVKGEEERRRWFCKLLMVYWGCSIFMGLCINSVNVNRINIIFYSHIIFAGIALYTIAKKGKIMLAAFMGTYMMLGALFFSQYFTSWATETKAVFYADFLGAAAYAGDLECDYYYITPDTQYEGSWNVSEILTMYAQQIDARYYQGKTDEFKGKDISYAKRYHYQNPAQENLDSKQHAAYIVKTKSLSDYDVSRLEVQRFGDYCVLVQYPIE